METKPNSPVIELSKREYFAAKALQGLCANQAITNDNKAEEFFFSAGPVSVLLADRLITELNKEIKAE